MNTICIMCPMGCPLSVEEKNGEIVVCGNSCKRGQKYGIEEFTHPQRSLTTLIRLKGGDVASVKTSSSIPKERLFDVVKQIGKMVANDDVQIGDIVARDVLGLGVDVIITGRK